MKRFQQYAFKLLIAGYALLYFLPLGFRALWDSDEGRYAEIGREMLQLKDWVSPHLNYVLYFEKPPLVYWLIAVSESIFGLNAFAARFWCPVFALLTIGLTYSIGKRWKGERAGLLAGAILGSSILFAGLSQFLVLDMALTFWMTLELFAFSRLLSERASTTLPRYAILAAVGAAGGMLTKGPVSIILPGAALVLTLYFGELGAQFKKISWGPAVGVFLLLAAPWYLWVSVRHPFFIPFFFIHEHVARFFTNVHQRNHPIYFFLLTIAGGFLPWSFFLPSTLSPWFARRGAALKRDPVGALLVVWSFFIFIFFSFSHSKLVGYVLPIFPALALLVAHAFDGAIDTPPVPRWVSGGVIGLSFLFMALLVLLKWPSPPSFLVEDPGKSILAQSGLLVLTLGIGVFVLVGVWGMRRTSASFAGVLLVQLCLLLSLVGFSKVLDLFVSTKGIAQTVGDRALPKNKIVAYGISYENHLQSLLFYTRRRLIILGDPGELAMGEDHDPDAADWFVEVPKAHDALLAMPFDTYVVTDSEHWRQLSESGESDHFALIQHQGALLLLQKIE